MLRSYQYRLYPNKAQRLLINKTIGACRFTYNLALETKISAYQSGKHLSIYDLMNQLPELKNYAVWLKEVSAIALCGSVMKLETAFKNFSNGSGFPKFKSKKSKQNFQIHADLRRIDWHKSTLSIPKIKNIPIILSRKFEGEIRTITITKTPTGKYFASILVNTSISLPIKQPVKNAIGIDLGLTHFAITSNGEKFDNPKYLRSSIDRLKVLQRRASRKVKGSNNRRKANLKVALLHERITNQRKDFIHKLSSKLVRENQAVCIEDLNIGGMVKNHNLAQSISDVGWGLFVDMLEYKADWYGKSILKVLRFYPSTKTCSNCGVVNTSLTLSERQWTCVCGSTHDRDINAAINIKNYCLSGLDKSVEPVELPALAGTLKQEVVINATCQLEKM